MSQVLHGTGFTIEIDGLREALKALEDVNADAGKIVRRELMKEAHKMVNLAKELAPEKTGALKDSLHAFGAGKGNKVAVAGGRSSIPYAGVQEWATDYKRYPPNAKVFTYRSGRRAGKTFKKNEDRTVEVHMNGSSPPRFLYKAKDQIAFGAYGRIMLVIEKELKKNGLWR